MDLSRLQLSAAQRKLLLHRNMPMKAFVATDEVPQHRIGGNSCPAPLRDKMKATLARRNGRKFKQKSCGGLVEVEQVNHRQIEDRRPNLTVNAGRNAGIRGVGSADGVQHTSGSCTADQGVRTRGAVREDTEAADDGGHGAAEACARSAFVMLRGREASGAGSLPARQVGLMRPGASIRPPAASAFR